MVKDMFADAGITGKTNHSLRATGASEMFRANVPPEKVLQERTGHRIIMASYMYERTSTSQQMAVSSILSSSKEEGFDEVQSSVAEKQQKSAAEKTLMSLAWDLKDLNECGRKLLVELDVLHDILTDDDDKWSIENVPQKARHFALKTVLICEGSQSTQAYCCYSRVCLHGWYRGQVSQALLPSSPVHSL